jgi:hypothetical protein
VDRLPAGLPGILSARQAAQLFGLIRLATRRAAPTQERAEMKAIARTKPVAGDILTKWAMPGSGAS